MFLFFDLFSRRMSSSLATPRDVREVRREVSMSARRQARRQAQAMQGRSV